MSHFVFVRHGESLLNVVNRQTRVFCGQIETPLTEHGRQQARIVGQQLSTCRELRIQTAISSTLSRSCETLDLILQELPYPVERLPNSSALNERSLGNFDGQRAEDVYTEFPQYRDDPNFNQFDNHFVQKAPGGENLRDVTARAWPVIEELEKSRAGVILVVSHYTTIRCVLGRALRLTDDVVRGLHVPNAAPIVLQQADGYRLVDDFAGIGL
jgi:broad specificity phosphatase PhoE